jgi:[acyl-carrier-protein] S-malonyltransferase
MQVAQLRTCLPTAALAFRGYDPSCLGRSDELLAHERYGPLVREELIAAATYYTETTGRPLDLVDRVERRRETTINTFADANVLILAMARAQLRVLEECFGIHVGSARVAYGFSIGELSALILGGVFSLREVLKVCAPLADDVIELSADVTLAVLFSRGQSLATNAVRRLCLRINQQGRGVIGISAFLSPNSMLLMGQGDTLDRFADRMDAELPEGGILRKRGGRWGPLHTPITWEKNVRARFARSLHTIEGGFAAPVPPVLSLATGQCSYDDTNAREILDQWICHPQRLWDAVYRTLTMGIETVIHIGPAPNIIPATFRRLSENVTAQINASLAKRALAGIVHRPWLKALMPERAALLRAPSLRHVILEDWLLEHDADRAAIRT